MKRKHIIYAFIVIIFLVVLGIYLANINPGGKKRYVRGEYIERLLSNSQAEINVMGLDFKEGSIISSVYTCDGKNVNPGFKWSNVPDNTKSIAIIIYDIDAPKDYFIHWMIVNIPPLTPMIPSNFQATNEAQGRNDFGMIGYGGPCPPPGSKHKYLVTVIALDIELTLNNGFSFEEFYDSVNGHILAYGQTYFYYQRG